MLFPIVVDRTKEDSVKITSYSVIILSKYQNVHRLK